MIFICQLSFGLLSTGTGQFAFIAWGSYGARDICEAVILKDVALESSRVAKLTAKQRECLHLVVHRKSSEEIARILNISKPAVDQRLISARRVLGAASRYEAAAIYARASGGYDHIIHAPAGVPDDIVSDPELPKGKQPNSFMLEEILVKHDVDRAHETNFLSEIEKEPGEALGACQRIAIMMVLTIGILAIVLIGFSISQSLSSLLTA